jgi:tRNA uridine 5-carbamoylmethylation protein Kti12
MKPEGFLIPFGILEVEQKQLNIIYGTSKETSDFIVDAFALWRQSRKEHYSYIKRLQIDLDNVPELESHRTQFIKRIVEFVDATRLEVELVYYPPYHSKYNAMEHSFRP